MKPYYHPAFTDATTDPIRKKKQDLFIPNNTTKKDRIKYNRAAKQFAVQ